MLLAVGSLKASPGASTVALALAARWPTGARAVLVEADPSGGDLAARYALPLSPGLASFAAAARREPAPELLWQHTQHLTGGVAVLVSPPGAEQARAALETLGAHLSVDAAHPFLRAGREDDSVVVVDCGRLDPTSHGIGIASHADWLLLCVRPRADELSHLAARLEVVRGWNANLRLVLVGNGYSPREITGELGPLIVDCLPYDPRVAGALSGFGDRPRRRFGASLGAAAAKLAVTLADLDLLRETAVAVS